MFRAYLIVSLFLATLLIIGGCAKKTVPEVEKIPAPVAIETTSEPPPFTVTESKPIPPTVEALLKLTDMGLETVLFAYDSYVLTANSKQLLQSNAERLMENSEVKFIIEGHCDERGSDEYNLALGERRALATKNYLTSLGVTSKRITIISYGEERPVSAGHNETAWSQNRRAEFR
ncbi:MAG: peptidoglycan-associated lipoprotein Pal [Desulfuromusa sp.]|nr:peptidoglycan-associated lipoprotein Pal [Desulfuromusa sp.]